MRGRRWDAALRNKCRCRQEQGVQAIKVLFKAGMVVLRLDPSNCVVEDMQRPSFNQTIHQRKVQVGEVLSALHGIGSLQLPGFGEYLYRLSVDRTSCSSFRFDVDSAGNFNSDDFGPLLGVASSWRSRRWLPSISSNCRSGGCERIPERIVYSSVGWKYSHWG